MLETGQLECLLWVNVLFEHGGNTGQGLSSALLWAMTGTQDPWMRDLTTALAHSNIDQGAGEQLSPSLVFRTH